MIGPGKYDDLATYVREKAKADGVIVMIIEGERGSGFSCQADVATTLKLPMILRAMADDIESDAKKGVL